MRTLIFYFDVEHLTYPQFHNLHSHLLNLCHGAESFESDFPPMPNTKYGVSDASIQECSDKVHELDGPPPMPLAEQIAQFVEGDGIVHSRFDLANAIRAKFGATRG